MAKQPTVNDKIRALAEAIVVEMYYEGVRPDPRTHRAHEVIIQNIDNITENIISNYADILLESQETEDGN